MALCPPSAAPIAHGLPGSSGVEVVELFLPLRKVRPIGWIGGKYTMSKPIDAAYSSRAMLVRNVPCSPRAPVDRGKNSYQALNCASTGSTASSCTSERPADSNGG